MNDQIISIIIPTFNSGIFIQRLLDSIKSQKYKNIETIVVDGGSKDNTVEIIRKNSQFIKTWISEPDNGIYHAMKKGVSISHGEWIYFIGADDILVNCLDKVARLLRSRKTIYYGDVYLPQKNKVYGGSFDWHTLISKNINHQSIFYPREVFDQYEFNQKYSVLADYDLNIRIWGERNFYFQYMPLLIAIHNEQGISNRDKDMEFLIDKSKLIEKYFGRQILLRNWFFDKKESLCRLFNINK